MKDFTPTPKEHVFFSTMSVIIVVAVAVGFSNTYLPKMLNPSVQLPAIIHIHGLVFMLWLAFFLFQVTLIARNKIDLHARLGPWGVLFTLVMLVAGSTAAITVAKLGHKGIPGAEFPDAAGFLLLNLSALFVFAVLTGLGWLNRHNPTVHKRFMLMATVGGLAPPGVARLPLIAGSTPAIAIAVMILIFAGPVHDLIRNKRIHWAYLVAIVIIVVSLPPVVLPLSATNLWTAVASMLLH